MFYRYKDEVVNLKEVALMTKDFLLNNKKWLIKIFFNNGNAGSMQFEDVESRDKVFDEIYKKMEKID